MSKEIAIKIENISKQYRLGVIGTGTLSHDLKRWWTTSILRKEDPYLKIGETNNRATKGNSEYVWALKDINLEIERGDIIGIIGKNGAGKSTLLKLLSRVTKPTTGSISYNGKIASLLEVGTGFHPEMTGRENIYMNGAIMGMTRTEITSKLDEIIAFAGVERYIDTPTKRYSSGMTVRLGFSIAAHLEPDILVVDEVLAVGDAEFQKKAIGKMQDVSKGGGRTVLFVSHNMASIKALCTKAILLENGTLKKQGGVDEIVFSYLKGDNGLVNFKRGNEKALIELPEISISEIGVKAKNKGLEDIISMEDKVVLHINSTLKTELENISLTIHVKDELGNVVFTTGSDTIKNGNFRNRTEVVFPDNFFNWGSFFVDLFIVKNRRNAIYIEKDILSFTIVNDKKKVGEYMGKELGGIHPKFKWETIEIDKEKD